MERFSALLAICAGNSPIIGVFPTQRPVTRSFDVFLICAWIWDTFHKKFGHNNPGDSQSDVVQWMTWRLNGDNYNGGPGFTMMTSSDGSFSVSLALCAGFYRLFVRDWPHNERILWTLMGFFICAWTNDWASNRDAGNLGPHKMLNKQHNDRLFESTWCSCDVMVML